jgi:CheY-like chemotaxis protein
MAAEKTIFLVDDDRDFLDLEKRILAGSGCPIVCFSDPQAALTAIATGAHGLPALVVTDLMMKALDSGFTFARSLKSDPRTARVPVIVVSAVSSQKGFDFHPRSAEELTAMGAEAFFDKPVDPAALLAKVKELLA